MRKKRSVVFLLLLLFILAGCSDSQKESLQEKEDYIKVTSYDRAVHLKPIWEGSIVYDESLVFIGPTSYCTLPYTPTEVFCVRDCTLKTEYVAGIDYSISGNRIYRLEGSSIPYLDLETIFPTNTTGKTAWAVKYPGRFEEYGIKEGDKCLVSESGKGVRSEYIKSNVFISYEHQSNVFSIPENQSAKASSLFEKLENNEAVKILFYGDSITTGCSTSGRYNYSPNVPMWPKMVFDYLTDYFSNTSAKYLNTAVGGWSTVDGIDNYNTGVKKQNADVLFLAFGMNDNGRTPETYKSQIETICNGFLTDNPDGLIILISPMMPSSLYYSSDSNISKFEAKLKEISDANENIIYAPVTTLFKELLGQGVDTIDYLANNVNHPNDFGARLYAQVILKSLMGDSFSKEALDNLTI